MLTRDSVTWWLVMFGAYFAYLATMPPPDQWTWAQWMQILASLIATTAGKLATSPLPGAPKGKP